MQIFFRLGKNNFFRLIVRVLTWKLAHLLVNPPLSLSHISASLSLLIGCTDICCLRCDLWLQIQLISVTLQSNALTYVAPIACICCLELFEIMIRLFILSYSQKRVQNLVMWYRYYQQHSHVLETRGKAWSSVFLHIPFIACRPLLLTVFCKQPAISIMWQMNMKSCCSLVAYEDNWVQTFLTDRDSDTFFFLWSCSSICFFFY